MEKIIYSLFDEICRKIPEAGEADNKICEYVQSVIKEYRDSDKTEESVRDLLFDATHFAEREYFMLGLKMGLRMGK